ncbi:MAG: hypothetical protein K5697_11600 [Lachnospiraceae bacterium]|nr:hypothetical protein [Lachnospiraceae bacterium]
MGIIDALFEVTDEWLEANRGFVDTRKYPYLDKAIYIYAREHNCSYDDALIFAKTGKKMGKLAE